METTLIDQLKVLLVGKKIKHNNQHRREVVLEVEDVRIKRNHRQITPDTPSNDWWGDSCDWDTISITFVDGSIMEYSLGEKLYIVNE